MDEKSKLDFNTLVVTSEFLIRYSSNEQSQKKAKKIKQTLESNSLDLEKIGNKLKRLNILEFVGQRLSNVIFPNELVLCTGVYYIDLSCSNLKEIPKVIFMLENISVLKLRNNQIEKLPNELRNMKNLNKVDILLNPIKEVPYSMSKFIHELPYMAKWV